MSDGDWQVVLSRRSGRRPPLKAAPGVVPSVCMSPLRLPYSIDTSLSYEENIFQAGFREKLSPEPNTSKTTPRNSWPIIGASEAIQYRRKNRRGVRRRSESFSELQRNEIVALGSLYPNDVEIYRPAFLKATDEDLLTMSFVGHPGKRTHPRLKGYKICLYNDWHVSAEGQDMEEATEHEGVAFRVNLYKQPVNGKAAPPAAVVDAILPPHYPDRLPRVAIAFLREPEKREIQKLRSDLHKLMCNVEWESDTIVPICECIRTFLNAETVVQDSKTDQEEKLIETEMVPASTGSDITERLKFVADVRANQEFWEGNYDIALSLEEAGATGAAKDSQAVFHPRVPLEGKSPDPPSQLRHRSCRPASVLSSPSIHRTPSPAVGDTAVAEKDDSAEVNTTGTSRYEKDFVQLRVLRERAHHRVMEVKHRIDKKTYVVKRIGIDMLTSEECDSVLQEVAMLTLLQHDGIVRYHQSWVQNDVAGCNLADQTVDASKESKFDGHTSRKSVSPRISQKKEKALYVQMELCRGKTLKEEIQRGVVHEDHRLIWPVVRQLLEALAYMHSNRVFHRWLRPSNIFLKKKKVPTATLR